jgi:choline dehydrogenase-like flavoprotein
MGKYIAFHNYRGNLGATMDGYLDSYYYGRRPCAIMMPNFRNVYKQEMDFQRGYMTFYSVMRAGWGHQSDGPQIGADYKTDIAEPGPWVIYVQMQGETIPKETNHVSLSKEEKDAWGIPLLKVSVDYDDNDIKSMKDFMTQGEEMLHIAGAKNVSSFDTNQAPGLDIHEIGGVRMGKDPKTSLLNKWNQLHSCPNVFVTDGSCMTSTSTQNPSLTFMAITARAANYAVEQLKKGNV